MKNLALILLFVAPFALNAQEPSKENKSTNAPTGTQKSINEKGIKGRGLTPKKSAEESTPAPATTTVDEQKTDQTPQDDPKAKEKDKKDPKAGTTTEKSINEKGVSSSKKKRSAPKPKNKSGVPTNSTVPTATATPANK